MYIPSGAGRISPGGMGTNGGGGMNGRLIGGPPMNGWGGKNGGAFVGTKFINGEPGDSMWIGDGALISLGIKPSPLFISEKQRTTKDYSTIHFGKSILKWKLRFSKLESPAAGFADRLVNFLRSTPASARTSSKRRSACFAANHESCARDSAALICALWAAAWASISARSWSFCDLKMRIIRLNEFGFDWDSA